MEGMIDQEIIQYLPFLSARQKEVVLSLMKTFVAEQQDWVNEMDEEQRSALEQSLAEMKAGEMMSHDEAMASFRKWLKS